MKITGSGPNVPAGSTEDAKGVDRPAGDTFANKLDKVASTASAATEKAPPPPPVPGRMTGDIGAALDRKEITVESAIDQVMGRILDRQLGEGAPPAARSEVESALRDALKSDPVLSAKVQSLHE